MTKKDLVFKTVVITTIMLMSACATACGSQTREAVSPAATVETSVGYEGPSVEAVIDKAVNNQSKTYARLELKSTEVEVPIGGTLKARDLVSGADTAADYKITFKDGSEEKAISSYGVNGDIIEVTYPDGTSYDLSFTLTVKDSMMPTISGVHDIEVIEGTAVNLLDGVAASDDRDGDITSSIEVSDFDVALLDTAQTVKYSVVDSSGNVFETSISLTIKSNPLEALEKTMYATADVNVRDASSGDGNKIGSLGYAKEVQVVARDKNTGWYQISYGDSVGFVSDKYLSDTKPAPKSVSKPSGGGTSKASGGTQSKPSSSGQQSSGSSQQTQAPSSQGSSSGGIYAPTSEEQQAGRQASAERAAERARRLAE